MAGTYQSTVEVEGAVQLLMQIFFGGCNYFLAGSCCAVLCRNCEKNEESGEFEISGAPNIVVLNLSNPRVTM